MFAFRQRIPITLLVASMTLASAANGQTALALSGGATIPTGDFHSYAKTGYVGSVGILFAVGPKGLSVGAEGLYGSNNHSDVTGDKTNLSGALGTVTYRIGDAEEMGMFVIGNLGVMRHAFKSDNAPSTDEANSGVAFGAGAGVVVPRGDLNFFMAVRYLVADVKVHYLVNSNKHTTTSFIPIQLGLTMPLGSKK